MSTKVYSAYKWRLHENGSYSFKEGPGFEIYVDCFCTENKNPDCLRRHHRLNIQTDLDWYSVDLYCLVNQNQETKFYHRISEQMFAESRMKQQEKPFLEELIKKRVNNGQLWVTSQWESYATGYDDSVIEGSEKRYSSYKPYEIRLNRVVTPVEYNDQPDEDIGVLLAYDDFEVKILIHSEFNPDIVKAGYYYNEENEKEIEEFIGRCHRGHYISVLILNKRTRQKKSYKFYDDGLPTY